MSRQEQRRMIFWLSGAIAALVLLSAGVSRLQLQPGSQLPGSDLWARLGLPGAGLDSGLMAPLLFWGLLLVSLVYLAFSPGSWARTLKMLLLYLLFSILAYGLFQVGRLIQGGDATQAALLGDSAARASEQERAAAEALVASPLNIAVAISSFFALAMMLAIVGWLVLKSRLPVSATDTPPPLALLAEEAQAALDEIAAGVGLRDSVLHCYASMCRVLDEQQGMQRQRAMTPREFEQHLGAAGLDDRHIRQLTTLFELVRYSPRTPGAAERRAALDCLTAIAACYTRPKK